MKILVLSWMNKSIKNWSTYLLVVRKQQAGPDLFELTETFQRARHLIEYPHHSRVELRFVVEQVQGPVPYQVPDHFQAGKFEIAARLRGKPALI